MTAASLDVIAAVRELLEPDPDADVDMGAAEPKEWAAPEHGRLYVYPDARAVTEVPFETGPSARQDFRLIAVFVAASEESAQRLTDADLSAFLDERLARYLEAVRRNRSTVTWHHLQAAARPAPRTLTARAVALELTGYRFVG